MDNDKIKEGIKNTVDHFTEAAEGVKEKVFDEVKDKAGDFAKEGVEKVKDIFHKDEKDDKK